jgi:hypothetical protein
MHNGRCVLRSDVGVPRNGDVPAGAVLYVGAGDAAAWRGSASRRAAMRAPSHCQSFLCSGTASQPGMCLAWKNTCPRSGLALLNF